MKNIVLFWALILLVIAGCHPESGKLSPLNQNNYNNNESGYSTADSSAFADIRSALNDAESFYTDGVIFYQKNQLDSSQASFEEALSILADLDFDGEVFPSETKWLETLLQEIESDYRLTLMSSGVLYSEGSAAAFREMFSDIKNFKKLEESGEFHKPEPSGVVTYNVPIYMNEKVENSLAYLQTVAHNTFEKYLGRSGKYIPLMIKILEEEGVPSDIVYLPLIESGFNVHAYSYARAMGPWQFIYSTGKRYGMNRDWWYDERRDFEKSTRAAARYLKDLYDEFQSWELALASYNGGEGRVRRLIKSQNTTDFWKLSLKKQTRDYVPLFMAAVMIGKEPEKYGFAPIYEKPLEWETVEVSKCMSFGNISDKTGIPVADLEELNPELIRGMTPPNIDNYKLRIPVSYSEKFLAAYDEISSEKNTNWAQHRVRKGETVSTIAAKYGVSMSSIISANNLARPYRIFVGQNLAVPTAGGDYSYTNSSDVVPDGSGSYTVKKGDTLWKIAQAHGVSLASLKSANSLSSSKINPGRKLVIPGSGGSSSDLGKSYAGAPGTYTVRKGDSLNEIANKHGVSVDALKVHNRLKSSTIYPNMELKIPQTSSGATSSNSNKTQVSYKVKSGDSLWKIAQLFDVTINDLMEWNNIGSPKELKRGATLKIYTR